MSTEIIENYTAQNSESGAISETSSNSGAPAKEVHVDPKRYKTKMCRNFLNTGVCPYETRCMFAHGPYELRTADENTRDGLTTEAAIKRRQQQLMYLARTATMAAVPPTVQPSCTCPDCVPQMTYTHDPYAYSGLRYSGYAQPPYPMMPAPTCECADCIGHFGVMAP